MEFSTRCVSDVLDLLEPDDSDRSIRGTGVIEPDAAILRAVADARPVLKATCRVGNILKDVLVKKNTKNDSDCAKTFFQTGVISYIVGNILKVKDRLVRRKKLQ